jgi:broad specificity phosphatase PhoE
VLILVRHGRTAANAAGLLLGRLDPELDEVGTAQAAAAAAAVARSNPSRILSSPLARTRATADAIGAATGLPVEIDDRWIELDYGEYDGVPLGDIPAASWTTWRGDPAFAPPGGESLLDLRARVHASLEELAEEARVNDVVVVSHVSPIKSAVAWALGVGEEVAWRLFLSPAAITRIGVSDRGPALLEFNATAHLDA